MDAVLFQSSSILMLAIRLCLGECWLVCCTKLFSKGHGISDHSWPRARPSTLTPSE